LNIRLRKIVLRAAAIVLLLLFCGYGILQYREYKSYQIPVHREAQTIFKVNIDGLITAFLKEYEFDFGKDDAVENKDKKPGFLDMGVKIPANLLIYTLSLKKPTTFFCMLSVDDSAKLKQYARNVLKMAFSDKQNYSEGKAVDGRITIFCSTRHAAIAYSLQKEDVSDVLNDLMSRKNVLSPSDTLLNNLKKEKAHITCINKSGTINFNAKRNLLILTGSLKALNNIDISAQPKHRVFNDSAIGYFYFNAKPAAVLNKTYNIKQYTIDADSILKHYNGYIDIELGGTTLQKDTVTTYEYNDNFEKMPVQTVTQTKVPELQAHLEANINNTLNYLNKQNVSIENKYVNREVFPLYLISISNTKNQLNFHTTATKTTDSNFISSPAFFGFFADVKKIREIHNPEVVAKYIQGVEFIKLGGKLNHNKEVVIEGSVVFEKTALKAIKEIIQFF
jgi:hypothetical protein